MIDAHHHMWKYSASEYAWISDAMPGLRRNYLLPELRRVLGASEVTGTIAVQARQTIEETEWLLQLAGPHSPVIGVVGWISLVDPVAKAYLERLAENPRLRGVRHVLQGEADDFYMLRDDFNRGVDLLHGFGLAYDILIYERHLPQTMDFVDRHPNQVFVLDHLGKPRIREGVISPWLENIRELAKRENVYCKVSGMLTEADWANWTLDALRPYFEAVLASFTPKRLMFGSDWPVVNLAGGHKKWTATLRSMTEELTPEEQESIFRQSAISAYKLQETSVII
jgi:L-fuconolactonase